MARKTLAMLAGLITVVGLLTVTSAPAAAATHYYTFQLRPKINGNTMCLDTSSSGYGSGSKVQIWKCNGTAAQKWYGVDFSGYDEWMNGRSLGHSPQYCLKWVAASQGSAVQMGKCGATAHELWDLATSEFPYMTLRQHESYCLDADANNLGNGDKVQVWTCNKEGQQQWETIYH